MKQEGRRSMQYNLKMNYSLDQLPTDDEHAMTNTVQISTCSIPCKDNRWSSYNYSQADNQDYQLDRLLHLKREVLG